LTHPTPLATIRSNAAKPAEAREDAVSDAGPRERLPQLPADVALPKIEIHVTEACNNRCSFCTTGWLNAEAAEGTLVHVPRERIREQLAEGRKQGARRALFQGGEPTVRRDLGDLLSDAYELGYEATTIFTNARMAASAAGAKWLSDMRVTWFQVSIQGGNAAAHDASVGATPAFKQTIAGTRRLIALGHRVKVNSVLTVHLLDSIEEYARLMIELRPEEVGLDTVKPSGALSESRARYADLVPSFAKYAVPLRDAMLAMERAGLVVRMTSFARCLAPGAEHLVGEEAQTTQTVTSDGRSLNKHLWKRSMQVKAAGCARCAYDDVCGGVYADYATAHGLDGLVPYAARVDDHSSALTSALRALLGRATSDKFGVRAVRAERTGGHALECFGPRGELTVLVEPRDEAPAYAQTQLFSIRFVKPESGAIDPRVLDAIVRVITRNEARLATLVTPTPSRA
jgi:MoaA/NifB/PqqE/SkfB family radical SAM enzyme